MGSIDLETANMFSEDEDDIPPPLGDLAPLSPMREDQPMENGEGPFDADPFDGIPQGDGGAEENEGGGRLKRMMRRNPQPKLDHNRLTSDRGLPIIIKTFEKIKFKGKGHEVDDLNTLMMTMEHWGNRLFPKMTFDEVIERIEKLGKKKPVQVCVHKIRMDMPLMDEDFVNRGDDEDKDEDDGVARGEPEDGDEPLPDLPNATTTPGNVSYGTLDVTDDQKKRMEENKRKALEKRAARMQQQSQNASSVTADEVPDDYRSQPSGTKGKMDSDDEDLENEMWNDLMSQQTSTQRPQNDTSKQGKKSAVVDLDSDEEDLEREAWTQISKSQVKKTVERTPEYDDETDDDDEYEAYYTKLKGAKPLSSTKRTESKSAAEKASKEPKTITEYETELVADNEPETVEEDGQSLSILNADDSVEKDTETGTVEQSQSIDGQSLSILNEDVSVEKDTDTGTDEASQSILDDSMNLHLSSSSADEGTDSDMPSIPPRQRQSQQYMDQAKDGSPGKEITQNKSAKASMDDDATCLPDDTHEEDDATCLPDEATCLPDEGTCLPDEAACLPEDNTEVPEEDLETQLPEDDFGTMADADTMAMTEADGIDTAEADTIAMVTQEISKEVPIDTAEADTCVMATQEMSKDIPFDTAEADTMEFEAMDTAEAETQAIK